MLAAAVLGLPFFQQHHLQVLDLVELEVVELHRELQMLLQEQQAVLKMELTQLVVVEEEALDLILQNNRVVPVVLVS
jgi:hypothetical protein